MFCPGFKLVPASSTAAWGLIFCFLFCSDPSRRGGATPPDTDNARLVRPVVTPTRPYSSSSPPPSRRRLNTDEPYSRSSVAGEALSSYNSVHRDFANRPDTSISLSKFLKQKRIPERSFYRKKKIAELIILDRPRQHR